MGAEVKYLSNGDPVLVLGEGEPHVTTLDGGRTNTTVKTTRVFRLEATEDVDSDGVHDAPPATPEEDVAAAAATEASYTYTDNGDGTYVRDQDGVHGTFGPSGFRPSQA